MAAGRRLAAWLIVGATPLVVSSAAQPAAPAAAGWVQRCTALASLSTPEYQVETAEWVPAPAAGAGAGAASPGGAAGPGGAGAPPAATPAHCLFRVTLSPRASGQPDLRYGTGIEVRLPGNWNQRLLFQGGGGLNGVLSPAFGNVNGFPSALARGFAVVTTDGGHRGRNNIDVRFGVDQQARLDFAYQAVERTTREAKSLLERFYARKPDYSYFMGCSTGGREAMLAAQRLPLEFDGVVAGNPSFNLTRIAANQVFSLQTVTRIAPRDAQGQPMLHAAFTDAQLRAVADTVLQQCDALDGLRDGMINDFGACTFDPRQMVCGSSAVPEGQCLTATQADGLRTIFGGARNSRGEKLYGTYTWDTGIAEPAWRGMHLGSAGGAPANASLGRDTLRSFAMTPPDPAFDPLQFDFDRDMAKLDETAAINDAVATLLSTFAARGGKMIVYHGLSDQAMATGALTDWYNQLTPRTAQGPQDWARLFLVPGMLHCAGGQATDRFDMLAAIQDWVERDRAPDRVPATGAAFPGVSRPLCPLPQVARYTGGDPASAQSFACR